MIIEKTFDEIIPVKTPGATAIKNIEPVQVVNPLPDSGKELPPQENKYTVAKDKIVTAVEEINNYIESTQSELRFSIDEDSGKTVIKVIDAQTRELIRQIPGEEALKVAQKLREGSNLEIFKSYT